MPVRGEPRSAIACQVTAFQPHKIQPGLGRRKPSAPEGGPLGRESTRGPLQWWSSAVSRNSRDVRRCCIDGSGLMGKQFLTAHRFVIF